MSRVDEALRRAAEAGHNGTHPGREAEPASLRVNGAQVDPVELAREPFPIEMTEVLEPALTAPTGQFQSEAMDAPTAPALLPDAAPLFERLDARLASKVVVDQNMLPASREQYRRLAATLHHHQSTSGLKVVMIASALVGEGKTLTASNLALTLSESYQRHVLLIDADLRRPSLHTVFKTNGSPGLSEGLASTDDAKLTLLEVSPHLTVLPAGAPSRDPMAGLTSSRMRQLIEEARRTFDWVIIDTPPVGLLTDASLLASMVDGAILVVEAGSTPYDIVKRAVETIGANRVLGVVLNRAQTLTREYGYGYDNYTRNYASVDPADTPS